MLLQLLDKPVPLYDLLTLNYSLALGYVLLLDALMMCLT